MGFLDAFTRGAAGPGLIAVGQQQIRANELDQMRQQREAERSDEQRFQITMANLRVKLAQQEREDADAFANKPERVQRDRERRVADETALGDVRLQQAEAAAKMSARVGREETVAAAGDDKFLKASAQIKLADPTVAAQLAQMRAATNASNANAGLLGLKIEEGKIDLSDKRRLTSLYDEATAALTDAGISDEERGKRLGKVQQQIALIKSKTGTAGGKDPELDTVTVEDTKMNPDGSTSKTTRKEVRKKGAGGDATAPYADGTELRGKDGNLYVVKDGQPVLKSPAAAANVPTRKDPISGQDLTEQEWDKKYGKGDFKKLYAPGEPSLKAW